MDPRRPNSTSIFWMMLLALLILPQPALSDDSLRTFEGHEWYVYSVAFSPDGGNAISGGGDGTLKLWDVASGKEIRTFKGHSKTVNSVAFSPDGKYVLSGSDDKTLKLWEVESGKVMHTFKGHTQQIRSVAFSPDGKYALSGSQDKTVKLWDVNSGENLRTFKGHTAHVLSVVFSPDGQYILSGAYGDHYRLWDFSTGQEVRHFKFTDLYGNLKNIQEEPIAFSPDGKYILFGGPDYSLKLWDVATGQEVRSFKGHTLHVVSVAFSPDGQYAISGSYDKTVRLWEVETGKAIHTFKGHSRRVGTVAFSPDERYAISGDGRYHLPIDFNDYAGEIKLWDLSPYIQSAPLVVAKTQTQTKPQSGSGKEPLFTFKEHKEKVVSVAFSPDGQYALSGGMYGNLMLWEVPTGGKVRSFGDGIYTTAYFGSFSKDGKYILAAAMNKTLKLWEVATGEKIRSFKGGHAKDITTVTYSPDGKYALSGSSEENTFKLWNVETGKVVRSFRGHSNGVESVAFSPDSQYVLSGSWDGTLKLWDISTGKNIRTFKEPFHTPVSVAFSPNGKYALSGALDYTLKLWEIATGKVIRTFRGHSNGVEIVAFSPDSQYALSGSSDNTVKLWNITTGKEIHSFKGHSESVIDVVFSPDIRYALSGSKDNTAKLWDLSPYIPSTPIVAKNKETPESAQKPKDTTPPTIVITSHEVSRGIVPVPHLPETVVRGRVTDDSGVSEVTVNGNMVELDSSGSFFADVPLGSGKTKVQVVAEDTHGNRAYKKFWVEAGASGQSEMTAKVFTPPPVSTSGSGKYHAVIIGINHYKHLPPLETAIRDAQVVDKVLREQYGFRTNLLIDATRSKILRTVNEVRSQLGKNDNLLIYYAGHGEFDKKVAKAYWLPVDAEPDHDTDWIIVDTLTSSIKRMSAKHVLIVADSCYSGTLTRSSITKLTTADEKKKFLEKMKTRTSRTLMASGGNEPVADSGGGGHSVFARAFIDALQNPGVSAFTAEQLFYDQIKERVAGSAEQVPEYNIIKNSGHQGGDFVFIKK